MPKTTFVDSDSKEEVVRNTPQVVSNKEEIPDRKKKIEEKKEQEIEEEIEDDMSDFEEIEEELEPRRRVHKRAPKKKRKRKDNNYMQIAFVGAMIASIYYLMK